MTKANQNRGGQKRGSNSEATVSVAEDTLYHTPHGGLMIDPFTQAHFTGVPIPAVTSEWLQMQIDAGKIEVYIESGGDEDQAEQAEEGAE